MGVLSYRWPVHPSRSSSSSRCLINLLKHGRPSRADCSTSALGWLFYGGFSGWLPSRRPSPSHRMSASTGKASNGGDNTGSQLWELVQAREESDVSARAVLPLCLWPDAPSNRHIVDLLADHFLVLYFPTLPICPCCAECRRGSVAPCSGPSAAARAPLAAAELLQLLPKPTS